MTGNESIKVEREPHIGAAVRLAVQMKNEYSIDVIPTAYIGRSDGNYSFIRRTTFGVSVSKTPKGEFGRDDFGIVFYSPSYEVIFVDDDEEGFESLVFKLKESDLVRKK